MTGVTEPGFLGTGLAFPLDLDEGGGVRMTTDGATAVRQSIWVILGTAPGERAMRPDFGCGIHDAVFDGNHAGTTGDLCESVRAALTRWEPRIDVLDVFAAPDPTDRRRMLIEVNYQVRSTNSRFNLVYPLYVG